MNLRKGGGQHEINILNLCLDSATFQHIAKFGKKKKKIIHCLTLKVPIHHHTFVFLFACTFTFVSISHLSNMWCP